MNRFAFTAVLVIPLSGCSGGEPEPAVTPDAREVGPIAVTSRGAPKRADGYWQLITIGAGGTEMGKQFLCVGADSEERGPVFDQIAINVNCSKHDFTRTAAGWNFDTACGPMNATTRAQSAEISCAAIRSNWLKMMEPWK